MNLAWETWRLQSSFQLALVSEDSEKAIHIGLVMCRKKMNPFKLGFMNILDFNGSIHQDTWGESLFFFLHLFSFPPRKGHVLRPGSACGNLNTWWSRKQYEFGTSCIPLLASILSEQSVFRKLALTQKLPTPEALSGSKEQVIASHY